MAQLIFYEKPGCATNRLQKQLLRSAGIELEERDLLHEPWTALWLRSFFGELPIAEWFNPSAPAIKLGEIDPRALTAEQALRLMVARPLLIRRPLLDCAGQRLVGFDLVKINALLAGQAEHEVRFEGQLEGCSKGPSRQTTCPTPKRALS